MKESKQAVNSIRQLVDDGDDEDDVEKVSWSGEPVGSKSLVAKRILSCDWLLALDPWRLRPQVFPGLSKRRQHPIRRWTESPPSRRSPRRGRPSSKASPDSPWVLCSKVRKWRGACWVEMIHGSFCRTSGRKQVRWPRYDDVIMFVFLQENLKEETCRVSLTVSLLTNEGNQEWIGSNADPADVLVF